ncbi:hypothetical protein SCLCIDRAFT_117717 [Scleroderma citrinum Foug A]|uniref:Uncharacterized protein n=1 Tax=Scleroderma citrinum Foug A TaxID=1036808 RepID=A0A0C3E487_9AGAM|nr:hypothetical protein SCLCIDRAFT_117717 [Scleroderma citrinum Foug A]
MVGFASGWKTSSTKRRSQTPSFTACVATTYSASAVDKVTSSCFFDIQLTAPPSRIYA